LFSPTTSVEPGIFHQNEIYLSLNATSVVDISAILAHCIVSSTPTRSHKPTSSRYKTPTSATENTFCANAVDPQRGLYYALNWDTHRERSLERAKEEGVQCNSDSPWAVAIQPVTQRRVKTSEVEEYADAESGTGSDEEYRNASGAESSSTHSVTTVLLPGDGDCVEAPRTPSKKRKRTASVTSTRTPRRKREAPTLAAPTPHSKRALRARARRLAMRAPPPEMVGALALGEASTETDPSLRAMHALHVGARPEALPCRAEEYARVMRAVEELLEEGSGGCICKFVGLSSFCQS
jgi:origin recognition complex subunit 1